MIRAALSPNRFASSAVRAGRRRLSRQVNECNQVLLEPLLVQPSGSFWGWLFWGFHAVSSRRSQLRPCVQCPQFPHPKFLPLRRLQFLTLPLRKSTLPPSILNPHNRKTHNNPPRILAPPPTAPPPPHRTAARKTPAPKVPPTRKRTVPTLSKTPPPRSLQHHSQPPTRRHSNKKPLSKSRRRSTSVSGASCHPSTSPISATPRP